MKNKTLFSILFLLLASSLVFSQSYEEATPAQRQEMMEKITAATGRLVTLSCDFEQSKEMSMLNETMISGGRMYYRNDNRVRWEYTTPYAYTFVFSNNRIMMKSGTSKNVVDVNSNNLFQEIVKIMISCMNGSGLSDGKSFSPRFFRDNKGNGSWMVALTPQQKEVRQIFSVIRLYFNSKDYSVDAVGMEEKNGDTTLIQLKHKRINEKIDDSLFSVD
jgi:outer membrane lipoprotein-sorting protein